MVTKLDNYVAFVQSNLVLPSMVYFAGTEPVETVKSFRAHKRFWLRLLDVAGAEHLHLCCTARHLQFCCVCRMERIREQCPLTTGD